MYASVGEPFLFSAEREYVKMLTGLVSRGAAACAYAVLMMVASGIAAAPSPPAPCVLIPSIQDLPKTYPCTSAPTFSSSPLTIAFVWPGVERSTCVASSPSIAFLKTVGIDRPTGLDPRAHAHAHAGPPARPRSMSPGSHHFVCCVDIQMPENPHSPHGNYNPLADVIRSASNSSSYSWCTCSEEICEEQLGGRVEWNQLGMGWKGFVPRRDGGRAYNALTGLPESGRDRGEL